MSIRNTVRAYPVMLKVGFSEAVAYRAEFFVWVLTTTMPLIMLALWSAVAAEAPVGRFGQTQFTAYFLATFIVRQLTSSWSAWQMNYEVRHGIMSMRLLKPIHPLWAYAAENWAALPLRLVVAVPLAVVALVIVGAGQLPSDPLTWLAWAASMAGAWLITFLVNVAVGSLSFHMESSVKVMDVWYAVFFVLSGYLIPDRAVSCAASGAGGLAAVPLPAGASGGDSHTCLRRAQRVVDGRAAIGGFVAVTWALAAVILANRRASHSRPTGDRMLRYAYLVYVQLRASLLLALQYRQDFAIEGFVSVLWAGHRPSFPCPWRSAREGASQGGPMARRSWCLRSSSCCKACWRARSIQAWWAWSSTYARARSTSC